MLAAWTLVDDPTVAGKMQELAPDAQPGSQEAIDAFDQAAADLDFDSSDGTQASEYGGKSLDYLQGGRRQYLIDKIEVSGKSTQEATQIAERHFNAQVRAEYPDAQYPNMSWGDRVQAFADKYQGTAGPARVATTG